MIFRAAAESDLERVTPLLVPDLAGTVGPGLFRRRLASREYRPGWTWIAQEAAGAPPLAVAFWWGDPREVRLPAALDGLFVGPAIEPAGRTEFAAALLTAAHLAFERAGAARPADYHLALPVGWRHRPDVLAALAWRQDAASQAGLPASLERISYEWTPADGLPGAPARLRFRAEPDDEVFVGLFRRVLAGTLDETSRARAAAAGPQTQAQEDVAFYRDQMLGDRAWGRVARTADCAVA